MLAVILAIVCASAIGVVMKLAESRGVDRFHLLWANYVMATGASAALWAAGDQPLRLAPLTVGLAVAGGLVFAGDFLLMFMAVKLRGMALPVILLRLSSVVTIGVSIAVFGEDPGMFQVVGILAAFGAAVILSAAVKGGAVQREGGRSLAWLVVSSLVLLWCFGMADLSLKLFERLGQPKEKPLFLTTLFFTALVVFTLIALARRVPLRRTSVLWGLALGVPNMLVSFFVVTALAQLPSYVVLPLVSAGTVVLVSFIATLAFKEKVGGWGLVGLALTLAAIVAMNL